MMEMKENPKSRPEQWQADGSRVTMSVQHENRFVAPQTKA